MKLLSFYSDEDYPIYQRIINVMGILKEEGVFCGQVRRLAFSCPTFLITKDNKDIGFVYFAEENNGKVLSVDMGIIQEYRNRGIGYTLLENLVTQLTLKVSSYVMAEVKPDNLASLKMVNKLGGVYIGDNYYLLQPERKQNLLKDIANNKINLGNNYTKVLRA